MADVSRMPVALASVLMLIGGQAAAQDSAGGPVAPGGAAEAGAPAQQNVLSDIVVTARRREENIQTVPVSVTALSPETLTTRSVVDTSDLQKIVPGVILVGAGSGLATTFSIRGQSRDVIGPGLPSVITYLNEVPLPVYGSLLPTFDLGSVQVLKGPQGTLFGRNTTGGAILLYSAPATDEFGGYAQATLGDYFWRALEGAVNVPLSDGVSLRLAGQYQKRDGYVRNLGAGDDQANLNSRAVRATLKVEPTDWFSNVTVFDYYRSRTNGDGYVPIGTTSATPAYRFFPGFNCGVSSDCDVDLAVAEQNARGLRNVISNVNDRTRADIWGVSNTTTLDFGAVTVKNIFGYRETDVDLIINTDGTKLALLDAHTFRVDKQLSDEVQVSGTLFDERLNWLVGGFYFDAKPNGPEAVALDIFDATMTPDTNPFASVANGMYLDRSKALFGNLGFAVTDWMTLNGGVRQTWDREGVCAQTVQPFSTPPFGSLGECRASAGSYSDSAKFKATTYTVGVDLQLSDNIFAYGTTRRGYRAGGLNTPRFGALLSPYQAYGPQFVNDVEIGAKTEWTVGGVAGRLNVALFRGIFKDLQRQITSLPPNFDGDGDQTNDPANTSLLINAGKAKVQGVEVDGVVQPTPNLTFNYGVSYIDAKFTSFNVPDIFAGNAGAIPRYPVTPEWSYTIAGRYELPVKLAGTRVALNADYYHISNYLSGVVTVPGFGVANASVSLDEIGGSRLSTTFFVNNLTDKLYLQNSQLNGSSPGIGVFSLGAPRMFGVRIRYNFGA